MFKTSSTFDKLIEKATSLSNLEPDWTTILQICDSIRQGDVQPKYAISAIKKKLYATNPNVELMALQVLESCVKNCGSSFHAEVTTKAFMEELRELVKVTTDSKVRDEVLRVIQGWGHAFRNDPSFRAVQDTVNLMKMEGYKFPSLKESDAMFAADSAPEWADGDCCHRCRVQFSMVQRKHHCRNCGQIFCAKCSSKQSIIPKYGIEKEVRVCDDCFDKLNKSPTKSDAQKTSPSEPKTKSTSEKSEQEIREEEELQLALALSQSEAESKEREKQHSRASLGSLGLTTYTSKAKEVATKDDSKYYPNSDEDPELMRYLNRDYWERKIDYHVDDVSNPTPSAPQPQHMISTSIPSMSTLKSDATQLSGKKDEKFQNGSSDEMETFSTNLRSALEIFVNRIQANRSRGRPIANDSAVQSLFMNITNMHSQLLKYMQQQDDNRIHYESLQDKLNQIRDARAALDALREEHQEKMRREAEEADRIRQQQMAQKLEIMRKKKQEYLQYQREVALQRMQEQERELLMRQEHQKYIWQQQVGQQAMMYQHYPNQQPQAMQYVNVQNAIQQIPQQLSQAGQPQLQQPQPQPAVQQTQAQPTQTPQVGVLPQSPVHTYRNANVGNTQQYSQQNYVNEYPYNMHQMAASLPVINPMANPQSNSANPQPMVTSAPQVQMSQTGGQVEVAEPPLISFD